MFPKVFFERESICKMSSSLRGRSSSPHLEMLKKQVKLVNVSHSHKTRDQSFTHVKFEILTLQRGLCRGLWLSLCEKIALETFESMSRADAMKMRSHLGPICRCSIVCPRLHQLHTSAKACNLLFDRLAKLKIPKSWFWDKKTCLGTYTNGSMASTSTR